MNRRTIRVGGVPEHFNFLWHLAAERGLFADADYEIVWQTYAGGTGAMCEALRSGSLDLAVLLTEGISADIVHGSPARILGTYVMSPLSWGVHVHAESPYRIPDDLQDKPFAISRYKSGSHLMAYVYAQRQGWEPDSLEFELVNTLAGARRAMAESQRQIFLWEKITTKPIVDAGEWRCIDEVRAPWPAFVLAGIPERLPERETWLPDMLHRLRELAESVSEEEVLDYVAQHYDLKKADVATWWHQTEYCLQTRINREALEAVQKVLMQVGVIESAQAVETLIAPPCVTGSCSVAENMYNWRVSSVYKLLGRRGKSTGPLEISDLLSLGHLDQYHYGGAQTSYEIADLLALTPEKRVFDVGSGVGGTARVLADHSGCEVLGVELQPELNALAQELTDRVGLAQQVRFVTADLSEYVPPFRFDCAISLLVYLHLPDRKKALMRLEEALNPGGEFLIEDFVIRETLSPDEAQLLRDTVGAKTVTSAATYLEDLRELGLSDLRITDMDAQWRDWTATRYKTFVEEAEAFKALYGEAVFSRRAEFYRTVAELFAGKKIGGVRIMGRKL